MLVKPRSTGTLPQTHRRNEATLIIGPLWTMLRSSLQLPIFCENLRCSRNHILPILSARSVQRYRNTTFWPSGDETKTPMVFGERASIFVALAILMWTTGCGLKLCKPKKIQETCSTQEVAMLVCRLGLWWQGEVWGTMLCLTIMEIEWAWTCSILKTISNAGAITCNYNILQPKSLCAMIMMIMMIMMTMTMMIAYVDFPIGRFDVGKARPSLAK